jgi:hypothetical protein
MVTALPPDERTQRILRDFDSGALPAFVDDVPPGSVEPWFPEDERPTLRYLPDSTRGRRT